VTRRPPNALYLTPPRGYPKGSPPPGGAWPRRGGTAENRRCPHRPGRGASGRGSRAGRPRARTRRGPRGLNRGGGCGTNRLVPPRPPPPLFPPLTPRRSGPRGRRRPHHTAPFVGRRGGRGRPSKADIRRSRPLRDPTMSCRTPIIWGSAAAKRAIGERERSHNSGPTSPGPGLSIVTSGTGGPPSPPQPPQRGDPGRGAAPFSL